MTLEEIHTIEDLEIYVEQEAQKKDRKCSGTWCHACAKYGCCEEQQ